MTDGPRTRAPLLRDSVARARQHRTGRAGGSPLTPRPRRRTVAGVVASMLALGVLFAATPAGATHGSAEDQSIAQAGTFVAADFPAGWREDIGQNHLNGFVKAAKNVKQCKPYLASRALAAELPNAQSADFFESTSVASNDLSVLSSLSEAQEVMVAFADTATTGQCLARVLPVLVKKDLARTAKGNVGTVKTTLVNPLVPTVTGADATAGYRLLMKTTVDAKPVKQYVESWLVRVGRAVTSIDLESQGAVFDAQIAGTAVNAATARLATAVDAGLGAGETAYLKRFLPTIPGYTYAQVAREREEGLAGDVAANPEFLNGASVHLVSREPASSPIAVVFLFEYKPEVAALPGFSAPAGGPAFQDAQGFSQTENGGTGLVNLTTVGTTPVWVVPTASGSTWRLFQCGRVEVMVLGLEEAGVTAASIDRFVDDFITDAC